MSTAATPIYRGQDFYVPTFEVKLRNQPLGRDVVRDITQVSYKDSLEELDSFEITINNWDAQRRAFKYSNRDLFDPGKEIELSLGYRGSAPLRLVLRGEITSLRPTFPSGGQPTLAISGLNLLHRLRKQQESHAYERKKDSQIARAIGQRLDVRVNTDSGAEETEVEHEYLFQDNQYDIVFLMQRARAIGYDLFVEETDDGESSLRFGPSQNVRAITYELKYNLSLIEFQPELTTANQVGEVTVRGWDSVNKAKIEATATRAQLQAGNSDTNVEQSFNQRKEIIATRPIHNQAEAAQLALQTLERIAKDMVKGTGSTVGLPDLRAGSAVQIEGVGSRFRGRYFVTSTTHTIGDSGYTTQFECRREES